MTDVKSRAEVAGHDYRRVACIQISSRSVRLPLQLSSDERSPCCSSLANPDGVPVLLAIGQYVAEGLPHALDLVQAVHRWGSGVKHGCLLPGCVR